MGFYITKSPSLQSEEFLKPLLLYISVDMQNRAFWIHQSSISACQLLLCCFFLNFILVSKEKTKHRRTTCMLRMSFSAI